MSITLAADVQKENIFETALLAGLDFYDKNHEKFEWLNPSKSCNWYRS